MMNTTGNHQQHSLAVRFMMMDEQDTSLVQVETEDQWQAYHAIRRQILFEDRGHFGSYDPHHPDDRDANNHPLLLLFKNQPIGAMRVDLVPEIGPRHHAHSRHPGGLPEARARQDHAWFGGRFRVCPWSKLCRNHIGPGGRAVLYEMRLRSVRLGPHSVVG